MKPFGHSNDLTTLLPLSNTFKTVNWKEVMENMKILNKVKALY